MGNIRQLHLKNTAFLLLETYPNEFITGDFQHNKRKLSELTSIKGKTQRNRIAGYITKILSPSNKKSDFGSLYYEQEII